MIHYDLSLVAKHAVVGGRLVAKLLVSVIILMDLVGYCCCLLAVVDD